MLAPELTDFEPPKVHVFGKENETIETVSKVIRMNDFYKSVVVTCPDEHSTKFIEDLIAYDSEYYMLPNCPVSELANPDFIEYFIKNGKVTCLSIDTNCMVQNCAAITPDGTLTIHVLEFVYQTLGLKGLPEPHGYYEIRLHLKYLKNFEAVKNALDKLDISGFYITWEPNNDKICPSSLARYFWERNISVTSHKMTFENVYSQVKEIPSLIDIDVEDIVEWMGIMAHKGDVTSEEQYISTYSPPKSLAPIYTNRMAILIAKGFLTPNLLNKLAKTISEYVETREPRNYWMAMSMQGFEESLWRITPSSHQAFQSHISSSSIIISRNGCSIYCTSQLKYS